MARCTHSSGNIQQFTEVCLDCGRNIYESDEEYAKYLESELRRFKADSLSKKIDAMEKEKARLEKELGTKDDDNDIGW